MSYLTLPGLSSGHVEHLEKQLRAFISSRELPLYRMMAYQMGWVDEQGERPAGSASRTRTLGQFALSTAAALGADPGEATQYAVAVELAHNAALIHEDVEDGNTEREGRPSVWWTWGPAQAINAGDGMHAMARLAIFSMLDGAAPREVIAGALETLDEAVLRRCEGEYLDITYQERLTITPSQYLEMAESRGGSLLAGACALGAMTAAPGDKRLIDAADVFGTKVGAALQVISDLESLYGERDQVRQGRLIAKKKNLAIVYAMETGDPTLRRRLGELYMQRVLDPGMIGEVASLADEAGGRAFCNDSANSLLDEAAAALTNSDMTDAQRGRLVQCARAAAESKLVTA